MMMTLVQMTLLLVVATCIAGLFRRNPSRAHGVLVVGLLVGVMVLPGLSVSAERLGWGLLSPDSLTVDSGLDQEADRPIRESNVSDGNLNLPGTSESNPGNLASKDWVSNAQQADQTTSTTETTIPQSMTSLEEDAGHFAALSPAISDANSETTHPAAPAEILPSPWTTGFPGGATWVFVLMVAWGCASLLMFIRFVMGGLAASRITRNSRDLQDHRIRKAFALACQDMGINQDVRLRVSGELSSPAIWSWRQPAIIVPQHSVDADVDWRSVMTHELAHLARRDHWSALVGELARCLLPWHPLVLYSCRRMYRLSEIACDAWAIRYSGASVQYAETLLAFSPNPRRTAMASMASRRSNIRERVDRILSERETVARTGSTFTGVVFVIAMMSATLVALTRAHSQVSEVQSMLDEEVEQEISDEVESPWNDEQWTQQLIKHPESARWHVGHGLGIGLSSLPGDRGYRILEACWEQIAVSVRKQVLKGFYPRNRINSHYFQVMNLGMTSPDAGIRKFAATYIAEIVHRSFEDDLDLYQNWYQTTAGLSADQVVSREIRNLTIAARDQETRNVREFINIVLGYRNRFPELTIIRDALQENGLNSLLSDWVVEDLVSEEHEIFQPADKATKNHLVSIQQELPDILSSSTNKQWVDYLTSISDDARWYVGRDAGVTMSGMPGARAFEILDSCWDEIRPRVQRQILKGFTPGFGVEQLNDNYFDILALGMHSLNLDVQDVAETYLEWMTLQTFSSGVEFDAWREQLREKTYDQIIRESCQGMLDELKNVSDEMLEEKLLAIGRHSERNPFIENVLIDSDWGDRLNALLKAGRISLQNQNIIRLVKVSGVPEESMEHAIRGEVRKLVDVWEVHAKSGGQRLSDLRNELWELASNLGETKSPLAIPAMIAVIEADNHYDTVYGVGCFGLGNITGVQYSPLHDGAWWRRWWERNRSELPGNVRQMEIPVLTRSRRGESYQPFPESLETLEGKLEWMVQRHEEGLDYLAVLSTLGDDQHSEPKAIPVLIGILDADNSPEMITQVGRSLRAITGVPYTPLSDGSWWRRWWEKNSAGYPLDVQSVEIPQLRKTAHGESYIAIPPGLDDLDGKIDYLRNHQVTDDLYERIIDAVGRVDVNQRSATDIPKLIGLIDADNSYDTIYGIGYFCLGKMTDVGYSPLHDGAWWRRWWEENKESYSQQAREIAIPVLPKTRNGKNYEPFPAPLDSLEEKIAFVNRLDPNDRKSFVAVMRSLEDYVENKIQDTDIPLLIGLIEADNSRDTVWGIGSGLGRSLGVDYNPAHDGAWWHRWWERNKSKYSREAQDTPIPVVARTAFGRTWQPYPAELDSLDGKLAWVRQGCPAKSSFQISYLANLLCEHNDPKVIPVLIGWMLADGSTEAIDTRNESFEKLAGVDVSTRQSPEWWKQWWQENQHRFSGTVNDLAIPDLATAVASYRKADREASRARLQEESAENIRRTIADDEKKTYFQIGPADGESAPEDGWKVLLILPGGDGSADFNGFCQSIRRNALPDDFIAIQLVAPVWSDSEKRVVWPTKKLNPQKGKFTTEEFIREAVEDLKTHLSINEEFVFAMGWSSGGPPVYVNSVLEDSPVTGSFVAMSVFHPKQISDFSGAEDHPYFIFHSPDDWIKIDQHARKAIAKLNEEGATTKLQTYRGGHGWTDDPLGNIRRGVTWLEENVK